MNCKSVSILAEKQTLHGEITPKNYGIMHHFDVDVSNLISRSMWVKVSTHVNPNISLNPSKPCSKACFGQIGIWFKLRTCLWHGSNISQMYLTQFQWTRNVYRNVGTFPQHVLTVPNMSFLNINIWCNQYLRCKDHAFHPCSQ